MTPRDNTLAAGTNTDSALDWLSVFPAVLTAAGVVLLGLTIGYSVFYDRLGVSPGQIPTSSMTRGLGAA